MLMKSIMAIAPRMYDASNTLKKPIIDTTKWAAMEATQKFFEHINDFADAIGKVGHVIGNPILIFNALSGASYWICIVVGLTGIVLYVCGVKKALKYSGGSLLGFSLIKLIEAGLNAI